LDKHIKKHLNENKKKKVINTYNIVNNIQDNSTQINIYTGNNLYKSLHIQNNSAFNSSNNTPANNSSKSPTTHGRHIKNRKNVFQVIRINNNTIYFNSTNRGKEKKIKYNLDLKKIIIKKNSESDKAIISARQITNKKLFEKLGHYFFKSKNANNKNYISKINIKLRNNSKNNSKNNGNNNNINYKNNNNNDILINKMLNKKSNSSKILKNKTNNNTPNKTKYTPFISKNHRKIPNICATPKDFENISKMNKASSRRIIKYKKLIGNLNDSKNVGIDDGAKLLIHSERNKISKIVFK
jgi:hypothetical protein